MRRITSWIGSVPKVAGAAVAGAAFLGLGGCSGQQSVFDTASLYAGQVSDLFAVMAAGAAVIWLSVMGVALYAIRSRPDKGTLRMANGLIVGGGVAFPMVVLAALLSYSLPLLPGAGARSADLRIEVSGEQWWWRVTYFHDGRPVESANEVRLPTGLTAEIILKAPDVIHSFWIPALGGKVDMIPGRTNRMLLAPEREGVFRGVCAEYCGESHALMAFDVVTMAPDAFRQWLAQQAQDAAGPSSDAAAQGQRIFVSTGCGACHAVRSTGATGRLGPDLTHMASRRSLAAATLPNTREALIGWLARTGDIKPGVHMPSFGMLEEREIGLLADYLTELR